MTTRQRPGDVGAIDARRLRLTVATDLHDSRLALSQATVASAAGVSRARLGRLERGEADADIELACRAARALGFRLSVKIYPEGSPVRDGPQLALMVRFGSRLRTPLRLRREVPFPEAGDPRAWDGWILGGDGVFGAEGETHLLDVQSLNRRFELKLRDDHRVQGMILVVARGAHNRDVLREHREALRGTFPLDGAEILRALGAGRLPPASGIVML